MIFMELKTLFVSAIVIILIAILLWYSTKDKGQ